MPAAGCEGGEPPERESPVWLEVPTAIEDPSQVVVAGDDVLVTGDATSSDGPQLASLSGEAFPVQPASFYGRQSSWRGVTVAGEQLWGFAGQNGGAHGNVRWNTWSARLEASTGLREDAQTFETFGGPSAGGLIAIAAPGDEPMILGSWASRTAGLDIALWTVEGRTWSRLPSAGTPLASSPTEQVFARGMTELGAEGVLITGAVTTLDGGDVSVRAAIWTAPNVEGPWTRTRLPAERAGIAQARSAACDADGGRCWVVGDVDGELVGWKVEMSADGLSVHDPQTIGGDVEPTATLVPPLISAEGTPVVLAPDGARTAVVLLDGEDWQRSRGPEGHPQSAVLVGDQLTVITHSDSGVGRIWTARLPIRPVPYWPQAEFQPSTSSALRAGGPT